MSNPEPSGASPGGDTEHRVVCPECGETETERVDITKPRGINSGTTLVESRACNGCYAGYKLKYVLEETEVHVEPEAEA